jgi:hypothetical protein
LTGFRCEEFLNNTFNVQEVFKYTNLNSDTTDMCNLLASPRTSSPANDDQNSTLINEDQSSSSILKIIFVIIDATVVVVFGLFFFFRWKGVCNDYQIQKDVEV